MQWADADTNTWVSRAELGKLCNKKMLAQLVRASIFVSVCVRACVRCVPLSPVPSLQA
eukprot:COSAG01_NODE_179_length_22923_cov_25.190535_24_plen_58_part_00